MIPPPTTRSMLSATSRHIPEPANTADDPNRVHLTLPIALKGWRVIRKISSGQGGDLYQVISKDNRLRRMVAPSAHILVWSGCRHQHHIATPLAQSPLHQSHVGRMVAHKVLQRLSVPGIPSYVESFDAAVPGDHLHCLFLRLDSVEPVLRCRPAGSLPDAPLAADPPSRHDSGWRGFD